MDFSRYFIKKKGEEPKGTPDCRVAACAILLEMATIDGEFSDAEKEEMISLMKREFHATDDEVAELMKTSGRALNESVDLWHFTNLINRNYSKPEKLRVVEMLWKVVYADGVLDKHEDYLVHKLATLLRVPHREMIHIKLGVLETGKDR